MSKQKAPTIKPYKGYSLTVTPAESRKGWIGKVECDDLIICEGKDAKSLERDFHEFIDNYLATCDLYDLAPKPPKKRKKSE